MATAVVSTHPTGMHSCLGISAVYYDTFTIFVLIKKPRIKLDLETLWCSLPLVWKLFLEDTEYGESTTFMYDFLDNIAGPQRNRKILFTGYIF